MLDILTYISDFETIERTPTADSSVKDEKTVTFSKPPEPSPSTDLPPVSIGTRQTTKMTEEDILRVTGEIPIIEKRDRPPSGQRSRPSSGSLQGSRPGSASRSAIPKSGTKKDMSKILTHLKKNMYDDTGK